MFPRLRAAIEPLLATFSPDGEQAIPGNGGFGERLPFAGVKNKCLSQELSDHASFLQSPVAWSHEMSFDRIDAQVRNPVRDEAGSSGLAGLTAEQAETLAGLFKALGHGGRLQILLLLAGGEKSVSELEARLGQRQAAVSQQLARLRLEGMVQARRAGKAIHYSLSDARVRTLLRLLPDLATRN